ncbi:MAG: helix-turn-helix transcriptional regulator [Rudanella sp.]|nr:helix-turn-helix transcriptional regulator [Rudanella sp.]
MATDQLNGLPQSPPHEIVTFWNNLTQRERDVLRLSIAGQSRQAIAQRLFVCEETVKSHRKHLLKKWPYPADPTLDGRVAFRQLLRVMAFHIDWLTARNIPPKSPVGGIDRE